MSLKARLQRQLIAARETSERFLEDFNDPPDWTRQVHHGANHALWFVGHMAHTDNFFVSIVAPDLARELNEYGVKFGMGSQPTSDPNDYPRASEVLQRMRERRKVLLGILAGFEESDLGRPTPDGAPDFLSDVASVFEMAVWHEGLHSGQLSVTRRALGFQPVRNPLSNSNQ